jgi:Tfp pilus assembly protein PilF
VQQIDAGQYEVATFTARRAIEADPQNAYAWSVLAEAAAGAEDAWAAKEAIERALGLDPENASLHATRGWVLTRAGDHARALSSYRTAARLAPHRPELRAHVIRALSEQGRLDEAITEAEAAYQANPDDGDARTMLAKALAERAIEAQHELPNGGLIISTASQASYVEALSNRGLSVQAPDPIVNEELRRQRDYARRAQRRRFSMAKLRRNYRIPAGLGLIVLAACCCAPNFLDATARSNSQGQLITVLIGLGALTAFGVAVFATCFEPQYKRSAALIEHTVPRRKGRGPGEPAR